MARKYEKVRELVPIIKDMMEKGSAEKKSKASQNNTGVNRQRHYKNTNMKTNA